MKVRISATIEESTDKKIDRFLKDSRRFRNKSHFIEEAVENYLDEVKNE